MENKEQHFRDKIVHVVCFAGSDRSRYVAKELNKRGYLATHGGIDEIHNYTTKEDLVSVGSIIFVDSKVKELFKQKKELNKAVKKNNISMKVMEVSESEKNRATQSGNLEKLREKISEQLDGLGYRNKNLDFKNNKTRF